MKNIEYISEDQYGMVVSYEFDSEQPSETKTVLIKESDAIEIIKALGKALQKDSFIKVN